jgi:DNA invertase Pin-like site-specific DNA recombinase
MTEARGRGVKFGRKKKLTPAQITKARKLIEHGERVEDVAGLWNVGRTTLYRALASILTGMLRR